MQGVGFFQIAELGKCEQIGGFPAGVELPGTAPIMPRDNA
jgi:hypothetical protein